MVGGLAILFFNFSLGLSVFGNSFIFILFPSPMLNVDNAPPGAAQEIASD